MVKNSVPETKFANAERSFPSGMTDDEARRVIASNPEFDQRRLLDWSAFRQLQFSTVDAACSGERLLQVLKAGVTHEGYEQLMARLFPEATAGRLLTIVKPNDPTNEPWLEKQLEWDRPCLQDPVMERLLSPEDEMDLRAQARDGWRTLSGANELATSPAELHDEKERRQLIRRFIRDIKPEWKKEMVLRYYGFIDEKPCDEDWTLEEIGQIYEISGSRVQQIVDELRWVLLRKICALDLPVRRPRRYPS